MRWWRVSYRLDTRRPLRWEDSDVSIKPCVWASRHDYKHTSHRVQQLDQLYNTRKLSSSSWEWISDFTLSLSFRRVLKLDEEHTHTHTHTHTPETHIHTNHQPDLIKTRINSTPNKNKHSQKLTLACIWYAMGRMG